MRAARFARVLCYACIVVGLLLGLTSSARAEAPQLKEWVDAKTIGLGDVVELSLEATAASGMPQAPQLGSVPRGITVVGGLPQTSTSTSMNISNGTVTQTRGLTATWTLRGTHLGTFKVGPPSVVLGTTRYPGEAVVITVVPPGKAPKPQAQPRPSSPFGNSPFGFNPFSMFGQLPGFNNRPFPQQPQQPLEPPQPQYNYDPRFAFDAPRGDSMFLHAVTDKARAVVGEQVTLTVYLYVDPESARTADTTDSHEAQAPDFARQPLGDDKAEKRPFAVANVGGRPWLVIAYKKVALFPLKSGDLEVGPMTFTLTGVPNAGKRASETLKVRVTEPPVTGRPPGYAIGDVGDFTLSADVSPRTVEQNGAIGVNVKIAGNGNLPSKLTPPDRRGIEWLDPQVTEKVGTQANDAFGGWRSFAYVVRLHEAGDVDLGDFTLPYFDPKAGAYKVARVTLGPMHVTPSATAAASAANDGPPDPLPGLPDVRRVREGAVVAAGKLDDYGTYWAMLVGMPLVAVLADAGARLVRAIRARRTLRAASPKAEMKARIREAEAAMAQGDARTLDVATARALEAAAIALAQVNVRGVATGDAARALEDRGVEAPVAGEVQEILRACENARFSAGAADDGAARERWSRARRAIDALEAT